MSRVDEHNEERRCTPALLGETDERVTAFLNSIRPQSSGWDIWMCTKEIIFQQKGNGPELLHVMYMLDSKTLELVLAPSLAQVEIGDDEMLRSLAMAIVNQIPVYPDTSEDEPHLVAWHERLVREGFKTRLDGKDLRFLVSSKLTTAGGADPATSLSSSRLITPAEAAAARSRIVQRLRDLTAAQSVLDLLDQAIGDLKQVLTLDSRNENALQACITRNPILFGPEYRRLIPKHRLGSEFEMDYALQRVTGFIDLVELESSTLELYTKSGEPRKELVHAEQQVLDWLAWIEAHGDYARHKLAGIQRPKGFVVIGRRASLSEGNLAKLEQRNRLLAEVLQILTYDDLLDRAHHVRALLTTGVAATPDTEGAA